MAHSQEEIVNFSGRRALITGGADRIGKAIALALAEDGAEVIIHYNSSKEKAEATAEQIRKTGGTVNLIQKDLSSESAVLELFEELKARDTLPDTLINSASIFEKDQFRDTAESSLERNMTINSYIPHWLVREMSRHVDCGDIINFLDTRISCYDREHLSYHLSKRNLFTLTKLTALELAPNFRVNGIAPGAILPPAGEDQDYLIERAAETPLKVPGSTADVIDTVRFLLNSKLITGQVIYLDGGFHLKGALYGA